jgi:two-component system, LytTR family, sensor kinase
MPQKPATVRLRVTDGVLYFSTHNWFKDNRRQRGTGIGTVNIKKMLDIVYPGKYTYEIINDDVTYTTNLTITL